jgi:hypothetical protein
VRGDGDLCADNQEPVAVRLNSCRVSRDNCGGVLCGLHSPRAEIGSEIHKTPHRVVYGLLDWVIGVNRVIRSKCTCLFF